jgi:hypothetical protein
VIVDRVSRPQKFQGDPFAADVSTLLLCTRWQRGQRRLFRRETRKLQRTTT